MLLLLLLLLHYNVTAAAAGNGRPFFAIAMQQPFKSLPNGKLARRWHNKNNNNKHLHKYWFQLFVCPLCMARFRHVYVLVCMFVKGECWCHQGRRLPTIAPTHYKTVLISVTALIRRRAIMQWWPHLVDVTLKLCKDFIF